MTSSAALLRFVALAAACAFGSVGMGGCVTADENEPHLVGEPDGDLTVHWSLEGTQDPELCEQDGAAALDLGIYDASDAIYTRAVGLCVTFEVTLELPRGEYSAEATLVDRDGAPVSATLTIEALQVGADDGTEANIDFPADAML